MSAISDILGGCDSATLAIAIAVVIIIALLVYGAMLWKMMKKEGMETVNRIGGGYDMRRPFNPDVTSGYEKFWKKPFNPDIKSGYESYHDWEGLRKHDGGEFFKAGHDVNPLDLFNIAYGKA